MQTSKFVQLKADVNSIINQNQFEWKIISTNYEDQFVLIELLDNQQRLIVDLQNKKVFETNHINNKNKEIVTHFEGSYHTLEKEIDLTNFVLKQSVYTNQQLTLRIMAILQLDTVEGWSVVDQVYPLYLIHYKEDADMSLVGHLRGILVDVEAGVKIAMSYGHTPTSICNQLQVDQNNNLVIEDQDGFVHQMNFNHTIIKRAFEGVILRVILHEGQVYHLTHRKIRPMKSRWGDTPFFTNMYQEANGPKDDELFNLDKKYSPLCYVFLVVHPTLMIASKQHIHQPYCVLLNINTMYNEQNCPFNMDEVDWDLKPITISNEITHVVNESFIHVPNHLSLEEANHHLQYGYYNQQVVNDVRLLPGEAVILYQYDQQGQLIDIVKVHSLSYDFRFKLRANDPNPYHRFFELIHYSYNTLTYHTNFVDFKQKFCLLADYDQSFLQNWLTQGPIIYLDTAFITNEQKKDRLHLLKIIWLNYLMSLPYHHQKQAVNYYDQFLKDRHEVTLWLQRHIHYTVMDKLPDRAKTLINSAKQTADHLVKTGQEKDFQVAVKKVIKNFVLKEYGSSLYSLMKAMKL